MTVNNLGIGNYHHSHNHNHNQHYNGNNNNSIINNINNININNISNNNGDKLSVPMMVSSNIAKNCNFRTKTKRNLHNNPK